MMRTFATLALLAALAPAPGLAHDLASVLGVVDAAPAVAVCDVPDATLAPRVVRTSIGPVYQVDDGGWGFGCPVLHGDGATGPVHQLDDGTIVSVSTSRIWRSNDDGCTWSEVPLPGDRWFAYDLVDGGDVALALARDTSTSAIFAVGPTDELTPLFTSPRDPAVDPDALTPDGAAAHPEGLLVAGARPVADVRLVADGAVRRFGVPQTPTEIQRLSVRAVDTASAWFLATTDEGRQLARLNLSASEGAWTLEGPVATSIHGPTVAGGVTWAVFDGVLHRRDGEAWVEALAGDFTCVAARGDVVWLCDLYQLLAVPASSLVDGTADPVPVFSFAQLDARPDRCAWDDATGQQCANDWVHYGAENGFVGREPAVCPDGGPPPAWTDDEGAAKGRGCALADGPPSPGIAIALVALAALTRRPR